MKKVRRESGGEQKELRGFGVEKKVEKTMSERTYEYFFQGRKQAQGV